MLSVPPNTRWIERDTLETCQKGHNKIGIDATASLFLLAVLQLKLKHSFSYEEEIKHIKKD